MKARAVVAALCLTVAVGIAAPQPASAATNYQVSCWSTTGSPYVSTSAVSWSEQQAFLNCIKGLISRRWGMSNCGGNYYSFYSGGYHYGYAVEYPNLTWCNYSRGSSFNAKGFLTSYW